MIVDFYLLKNSIQSEFYFNKDGLDSTIIEKYEKIAKDLLLKCKGQKMYRVSIEKDLDDYKIVSIKNTTYFWEKTQKEYLKKYHEDNKESFLKGEFIVKASSMGIKCDNEECGWYDWSVTQDQYPDCIDKPCPCCGDNLLTKEAYENVQKTLNRYKWFNNEIMKLVPNYNSKDYVVGYSSIDKNGRVYNAKEDFETKEDIIDR